MSGKNFTNLFDQIVLRITNKLYWITILILTALLETGMASCKRIHLTHSLHPGVVRDPS